MMKLAYLLTQNSTRVGLIFLVLGILYIYGSRQPVIYDETEGQYAGAAREMIAAGEWIVPSNNGVPRFQKPPFLYWMMVGSMKIFGVNEFAARLPGALAALGWLFAVYLLGRRIAGEELGRYAVIMLATACGFFVFCHVIMPESLLSLFITLTIWAFLSAWSAEEGERKKWFTWAWVFMACASMSKGLHGAAWPLGAAVVTAVVLPHTRSFWKGLLQWRGMGLFFLILLPWYIAVELRYPGFIMDQFINEQVGHALNKRWPPSSNQVDMGVYIIQHLFMLAPSMLFLPAAIRSWWLYRQRREDANAFSHRFMIIWFLVTFLTTLFSARQDYYTMSAWGAWAIFLATPWITSVRIARRYYILPLALLSGVGVLLSLGGIWLWMATDGSDINVVPIVERDHLWTAIQGFSLGAWRTFSPLMIATGLSLGVGGAVAIFFAARGAVRASGMAYGISMIIPFLMSIEGFASKEDYFSLQNTADYINENAPERAMVIYSGYPNLASSLFFYMDRQTHWVGAPVDYEYATRAFGIGEELYLDEQKVADAWASPRPVYLITEESELEHWSDLLREPDLSDKIVTRSGTRVTVASQN
jgi:4-amino-4-deoxy-L-arabinose transferase-like glycosyltransferase